MIEVNPLNGPIHGHLSKAVHGHAEIVAAIASHVEQSFLRREIRREQAARGRMAGGGMGGAAPGANGDPSGY